MRFAMAILPLAVAACLSSPAQAANQAGPLSNINISAILDGGYTLRDEAPEGIGGYPVGDHGSGLPEGFWLDHTELAMSSNVDDMFYGKLSLVVDADEHESELEMEEAFIQTLALPGGLSVRAGRFLANIGYLNSKHPHTDYFVDRPLTNQAFLAGHYYDDGARLTWVAPTDLFVELGVEGFAGSNTPAASGKSVGAVNAFLNLGGDINDEQSWQAGLSYLGADADPEHCSVHSHDHDEHEHEDEAGEEDHAHAFDSCDFKGDRDLLVLSGVWKWAPGGNYKYRSLTVQGEYFRLKEDGEIYHDDEDAFDPWSQTSTGGHLAVAYQFAPQWTAGVRASYVKPDDGYGDLTATAYDAMIQYNHSHFSTVRLQYTREKRAEGMQDDVVSVQYIMSLGDHGAHLF